jgi:hypothetical protein
MEYQNKKLKFVNDKKKLINNCGGLKYNVIQENRKKWG